MKKALVCAHVASMIQQFNMENIRLLQKLGYTVDVVCNMEQPGSITREKAEEMERQLTATGVGVYHMPAPKKVLAVGSLIRSFRILRALMKEKDYALVHCHSPIGGAICRAANRFSGNYRKTKMVYTAHGFHFYQGAPRLNWLLYYPVERLCARWTDVLITINHEDYRLAKKKMRAKKTVYVAGVGIDTEKMRAVQVEREAKLRELGISTDADVILSVGELNENKNHRVIIEALAQVPQKNVHYLIAGRGEAEAALKDLARRCMVEERVHLLGYRSDVPELMAIADIYAFPSYREGLSAAVMEAMTMGKVIVCSRIRGNVDLVEEGKGGFLLSPDDVGEFAEKLQELLENRPLREAMGAHNRYVMRTFDRKAVEQHMEAIYSGRI